MSDHNGGNKIALAMFVGDSPIGWLPSRASLGALAGGASLVVAARSAIDGTDQLGVTRHCSLLSVLLSELADSGADWLVVAGAPVLVPTGLLDRLEVFGDDRFAAVSFLSNAAGALSFPHPGSPVPWSPEGLPPDSITGRLRSYPPPAVVAPTVAGPIVAFSSSAVRMLPAGWDSGCTSWAEAIAEFGLAIQARGLMNGIDTGTFVHALAEDRHLEGLNDAATDRLSARHRIAFDGIEIVMSDDESPFRLEHRLARTRISGIDVLIDGSCLGPLEMGTQVGLVAIVLALAERADIARIGVTLPGKLPVYARPLAELTKVEFLPLSSGGSMPTEARHFDIAFRPFQPDSTFDLNGLRGLADRVIVSILDLIAYQNGSYFGSRTAWDAYRGTIRSALSKVDAATTISHDVVRMIELERLPIAQNRVFPVPYGTEHVQASAQQHLPSDPRLDPSTRFLFCLGTNYGHKNRDLAIRATDELRRRGHDVQLIMAGPSVPHGTSRSAESAALATAEPGSVLALADVTPEERNWLLAHAEAVLYPTSAEGFGLVPYEAAWMGTPTVFVPFGPLSEIAGDLPVIARSWSPDAFADAVESILCDPALGSAQIRALQEASRSYSWAATADRLCAAFREVLAVPTVRSHDRDEMT